jgi:ComF family protein
MIFPQICCGCGAELFNKDGILCIRCLESLPETCFELHAENPVERKFWGRIPLEGATAQYYFSRESLMQHLMHQFKYKGYRELGLFMGRLMGQALKRSRRFEVDGLVPLPLFAAKEKKRGFNQATILCEGMAESLAVPVIKGAVIRSKHTETQTKKGRVDRWQNMEGKFLLANAALINNRRILLVDDVVTTGATLEACGSALLEADNVRLSIATLLYAL